MVQLHLGGGTPNFLSPAELERMTEALAKGFNLELEDDRDFSVECDPRYSVAVSTSKTLARARLQPH